ncbi:MAG: TetR family transcriptional regulator [Streptosporangiaceae bacterium]
MSGKRSEAGGEDTADTESAATGPGVGGPQPRKRTGRRPGGADTRGTILDAARAEFAAHGYEKTSMRAIARAAGVDAALLHHYFGSKQQLFLAALDFPLDPDAIARLILAGDQGQVGDRVVRFALTLWEDPPVRERLLAALRAAATNEQVADLFRGFVQREVVARVVATLGDGADLRVELAMSQIIGLAMARYVFRVEPLASADVDEVAALVGPVFQRYLRPSAPPFGGAPVRRH